MAGKEEPPEGQKNLSLACLRLTELLCYDNRTMAVALISDLHSNQESLTNVLADIESQGIKDVYCLGDLIGYGPDPRFIVERAMNWKLCLMGNQSFPL